jgi:hypothetical protein
VQLLKYSALLLISVLNGCASNGTSGTSVDAGQTTPKSTKVSTLLIKGIAFSQDATVPAAVKKECNILQKLSNNIQTDAATQYTTVLGGLALAPADADVLTIEIVNLYGSDGGGWTGVKAVMIQGTLTKKGEGDYNFKALRASNDIGMGMFMSTCAMLGHSLKTLSKDVADWLTQPSNNAKLGDMMTSEERLKSLPWAIKFLISLLVLVRPTATVVP